jgi:UDP-glucose 4-epimerase
VKSVLSASKQDVLGYDEVIHCAAQVSTFLSVDRPADDFRRNAESTFHLFELLRKYNDDARVVFTSSRSVLGEISGDGAADEGYPVNPTAIYAVHKAYGEMLCRSYAGLYGMKFTVLRPSNVYGPGQPYWVGGWYDFISYWIKLALEKAPIPIYGDGNQVRDYTYIGDISAAFELALKEPRAIGETFLLTSGEGINLLELARIINRLTRNRAGVKFLPARKGDLKRFVGDSRKAKKILGWTCKVPLVTGLNQEVGWVRSEIGLSPQH